MPQNGTESKSISAQVLAWCRQATIRYLNQCLSKLPTPYGVTRLQCVKFRKLLFVFSIHYICQIVCPVICARCQTMYLISDNSTQKCNSNFTLFWTCDIKVSPHKMYIPEAIRYALIWSIWDFTMLSCAITGTEINKFWFSYQGNHHSCLVLLKVNPYHADKSRRPIKINICLLCICQTILDIDEPCVRLLHDDVIKWKHFQRYLPFVRGIHRSPVNSPRRSQWRWAFMFSLIYARINDWVNKREAGDLRRHCAHYDVIVISDFKTNGI